MVSICVCRYSVESLQYSNINIYTHSLYLLAQMLGIVEFIYVRERVMDVIHLISSLFLWLPMPSTTLTPFVFVSELRFCIKGH